TTSSTTSLGRSLRTYGREASSLSAGMRTTIRGRLFMRYGCTRNVTVTGVPSGGKISVLATKRDGAITKSWIVNAPLLTLPLGQLYRQTRQPGREAKGMRLNQRSRLPPKRQSIADC